MKDPLWTVADRLLGAALEREPHERAAFLRRACGGDEALRREVESLLAHDRGAGDFLEPPMLDLEGAAPTSARRPLPADRELGPYRILDLLGSGGMGDVYRARDTRLKRDVALKILPDAFASNPDRRARFQREAEILASLNHPHIAAIHGIEESAGTRALVLELVEGETLAERIVRGPIPVDEALRIARQIADALEAAHEHGIIHRDLKPANVKATSTGLVKVLDFGLAKAVPGGQSAGRAQMPAMIDNATGEGLIVGTAAYMSPEQALGQPVDRRTDIWAFGCVLYEMLTGHAAFARSTIPESLASVLRGEPAWNDLPETTPLAVRRLLQKCLAKKVARRLHDIADARIEIDDAIESPAASTSPAAEDLDTPPRPAAGRPTWRAAAGLGAVALVVGGLGLMVRDFTRAAVAPPNHETVRFAIHLQAGEQFSIDTGLPVIVATSPDGNQIVYAARGVGGDRLYLRRRGDLEASPIAGTEGAIGPFFSPDGQWIGFASGGMLRAVPVLGGGPRALSESTNLIGASWGPRDTIVYSNWDSGLVKVSAQGGLPEALTTPDERESEFQHSAPHVLPDGTAALFTVNRRRGPLQLVEVVELATGRRRSLIEGRNPVYVSSGHVIFARGSTLFKVPFDVSSREVTGPAIRLLDGIRVDGNDTHFAVALDGTLVYVPELSRESRLVWYGQKGNSRPLDIEHRRYSHPRISPNGTRVVLNVPRASGELEIWIYDAARGTRTRLSPTGSRPIWTADGQGVTFQMGGSLYSVPADDSARPQLVLEREDRFSGLYPLAWSRNGHVLMFSAPARATNRDVWMLPGDRAITPFLVTPRDERAAMFSPDGRWVVYAARETGREEQVYVQPYPGSGGRVVISRDGGIEPVWSPTGREIFYRSSDGTRIMSVEVRTEPTLTVGESRVLFAGRFVSSDGSYWSNYDVSPDGQEFLMLEADQASTPRINVILNWTEALR